MDEYVRAAIIGFHRCGATWEEIHEITGHSIGAIKEVVIAWLAVA